MTSVQEAYDKGHMKASVGPFVVKSSFVASNSVLLLSSSSLSLTDMTSYVDPGHIGETLELFITNNRFWNRRNRTKTSGNRAVLVDNEG